MAHARNVGFLSAKAEPQDRMLSARLVWNSDLARESYAVMERLQVSDHTRDSLLKSIGQAEASFQLDAQELLRRV